MARQTRSDRKVRTVAKEPDDAPLQIEGLRKERLPERLFFLFVLLLCITRRLPPAPPQAVPLPRD